MVSEFGKSKNKVFDVKNKELFFFNSEHIRIDWGQVTADKNKFNYFFIILLFLELLITLNLLVRSEKNKILLML